MAAVLATYQHHSAPREQRTARTGERAREELHGYGRCLPLPGGWCPRLCDGHREDVGEAPAAGRPAPLLEVLPQERVQQCIVEQIVDPVPVVPMPFMVEPQMVKQLVDILSSLDFRVAEQVIEVPKIECPPRAARTVLRAPQTVEQLVEVPTPVSYSSLLQRTMEQYVVIPVPGFGGRNAGLQGFLPEQNSTTTFCCAERISERIAEQIVDIPVSGRWRPSRFSPRTEFILSCTVSA